MRKEQLKHLRRKAARGDTRAARELELHERRSDKRSKILSRIINSRRS